MSSGALPVTLAGGAPSRWSRKELLKVASEWREELWRKTAGRISLSSFIAQHLPVLHFPADVAEALSSGDVTFIEAATLARLTANSLVCSPQAARARRRELLLSHQAVQRSQTRLRARRVKDLLGELGESALNSMSRGVGGEG